MQTIGDLIDELGGTVAVATRLAIPPQTVSSWRSANKIPNWRWPGIIEMADEREVKIPSRLRREAAA